MEIFSFLIELVCKIVSWLHNKSKERKEYDVLKDTVNQRINRLKEIDEKHYWCFSPLIIRVVNWPEMEIKNKGDKGWKRNDIECKLWENEAKELSGDLKEHIEKIWKREQFKKNTERYGLYSFEKKREGNIIKPVLTFYHTDYKKFIGTNKNLKQIINSSKLKKYYDKRLVSPEGYEYLEESMLSNDLATATTVIIKENKVILEKRSQNVNVLPGDIHTSIAEGMLGRKDEIDGIPDPFLTIIRGAKEELEKDPNGKYNISEYIKAENITILAFGIYLDYAQPFIACNVKIDLDESELLEKFKELKKDYDEGKKIILDYSCEKIIPYLFGVEKEIIGKYKMAELDKISLILSLIQDYGKKYVEKCFSKYFIEKPSMIKRYFQKLKEYE